MIPLMKANTSEAMTTSYKRLTSSPFVKKISALKLTLTSFYAVMDLTLTSFIPKELCIIKAVIMR